MANKTILHISTVHPRRDTRIFYRECISVHKADYDVYLLVADGKGNEEVEGVHVIDLGKEKSRLHNFFKGFSKIMDVIADINPVLVQFHDPELIFVGRKITKKGIPVIFDIHENVAAQILNKTYIPKFLRKPGSIFYRGIERNILRHFHLVIAEYSYAYAYRQKGKSLSIVLNMPDIEHFEPYINQDRTGNELFYIGVISNERCLDITLEALRILKRRKLDFFMHYIGPVVENENSLELDEIKDNIKFYGRMDSKEGFEISKRCVVGLSVLKPIKNYVGSYSTKIFEYMSIGLPVITSNFTLYKDVVEQYECGFCVDPYSAEGLANSIEELLANKDLAAKMGQNGIKAVADNFNWSSEKDKLLELYSKILEP